MSPPVLLVVRWIDSVPCQPAHENQKQVGRCDQERAVAMLSPGLGLSRLFAQPKWHDEIQSVSIIAASFWSHREPHAQFQRVVFAAVGVAE